MADRIKLTLEMPPPEPDPPPRRCRICGQIKEAWQFIHGDLPLCHDCEFNVYKPLYSPSMAGLGRIDWWLFPAAIRAAKITLRYLEAEIARQKAA